MHAHIQKQLRNTMSQMEPTKSSSLDFFNKQNLEEG